MSMDVGSGDIIYAMRDITFLIPYAWNFVNEMMTCVYYLQTPNHLLKNP